jgi:hypothetical protein
MEILPAIQTVLAEDRSPESDLGSYPSCPNPTTGMIARWLDVLARFNFRVLHRAGTSHGNACALGNRIPGSATTKRLQLPAKSEMLMAQQNDNVLMQVRGWVKTLKPPDKLNRPGPPPGEAFFGHHPPPPGDGDDHQNEYKHGSCTQGRGQVQGQGSGHTTKTEVPSRRPNKTARRTTYWLQ